MGVGTEPSTGRGHCRVKTFEEVMQLTRTVSSPTALSDEEAGALYRACCAVAENGLVIEIGCQLGRSSSLIAQMAEELAFDSIHVDPFTDQLDFLRQWHEMMWKIRGRDHAYTHLCMRTDQAIFLLMDMIFDLAYIDGDHEYPGVMTDLEMVGARIKVGGLLCMHDYGRDSLPGVAMAAHDYLKHDQWEQVEMAGTMGVWRKL